LIKCKKKLRQTTQHKTFTNLSSKTHTHTYIYIHTHTHTSLHQPYIYSLKGKKYTLEIHQAMCGQENRFGGMVTKKTRQVVYLNF